MDPLDFIRAIDENDLQKIKEIYQQKPDFNDLFPTNHMTPLDKALRKGASEEIIRFLLTTEKIDINAPNGDTAVHHACWFHKRTNIIKLLIEAGGDINYKDGIQVKKFIFLLADYNGDFTIPDKKTPLDYVKDEKLKQKILNRIQTRKSINQDFLVLFERKEFTDSKLQLQDGEISFHKLIVKSRIGEKYDSLMDILQNKKKNEVEDFLKFIYSSIFENSEVINDILNQIGIQNQELNVVNYEKLYQEEESKDFKILFEDGVVLAHKIILIARSDLFRGLFLSVVDESNQVHDYSGISKDAFNVLIKFLYTEKLDSNIPQNILQDLQEKIDYFQLNENSSLDEKIKEILK
ncbi:btb/poz domain-containing protein [Anaeramoeba ignava]|uniref:Btb/poz domain-containing protein n=1 Tax=Anaeramoeba ignava TaxID=1746090 RepID=A0A9Q0REW4_ANAIG|nr:btb/poz domain-containing protein [Anaeramoeba ignava]